EPCSEEQASNSSGRVSFSPHNQKTSSRKVRKNPVLSENQQDAFICIKSLPALPFPPFGENGP
ncbi:MAG: hypothetical protein LKF26_04980, partial [Acetobacter fabarum]|nr:hypothetical protein [Acetobacter fabarum]MCH4141098.1 hypothetical protein [Acetobacter fabarum]